MKLVFLLLFAVFSGLVSCTKIKYDGYKVYRLSPLTKSQNDALVKLETADRYDFWSSVNKIGLPVDILVKPEDQDRFKSDIIKHGMSPQVHIDDVQKLINSEVVGKYEGNMTWTAYYPLDDIYAWMNQLTLDYPDKVTNFSIGQTYEGRELRGMKIAFKSQKRAIVIGAGSGARDWISPTTVTFIANEILTNQDPEFRRIIESFEWHLFPSTNPDGYVYTHTTDRYWRKTRSRNGDCYGAYANKNWDIHWNEIGASQDPCSILYAGTAAFSEVETKAFSTYITSVASKMDVYIDFHSYSQKLMIPYGHTDLSFGNAAGMLNVAIAGKNALYSRHKTVYQTGIKGNIALLASGGSADWVKDKFNTQVVLEYNLRDRGEYDYDLPPEQILPNGEEVMDSIIGALLEAEKYGYVTIDK